MRKHLLQGERRDLGEEVTEDWLLTVYRIPILSLFKGYFVDLTFIIQHQIDRIDNDL